MISKNKFVVLALASMAMVNPVFAEGKTSKTTEPKKEKAAAKPVVKEKKDQADEVAIQGTWQVVTMKSAGRHAPAEIVNLTEYVFKGERLTILKQAHYTFKLDPLAKPKPSFDMTPIGEGEVMKGIYLLRDSRYVRHTNHLKFKLLLIINTKLLSSSMRQFV